MAILITGSSLRSVVKAYKGDYDELAGILTKYMNEYEINTVARAAGFLAQLVHESFDFNLKEENLNYSADGLLKIFPKYFKSREVAELYARKPEKIANRVYGGRLGNGGEETGDGYMYRGSGFIQLTGKSNHTKFALATNKRIDEVAKYVRTIEGAAHSACWFWKTNNLNAVCDKNDIVAMTKVINGGTIGLDDRTNRYESYKIAVAEQFQLDAVNTSTNVA